MEAESTLAGANMPGRRAWAIALACLASAVSGAGFLAIVNFDSAPAREPAAGLSPPVSWPRSTAVRARGGRDSLLMFVHPFCGCTAASVSGLTRIAARHLLDQTDITFVVFRPNGGAGWVWSDWPEVARSLPGSRMLWDEGGVETRIFAARVSGHVLLYSPAGRLLFQGGITGSRGHEGDNYGLSRLAELLAVAPPEGAPPAISRVFGCALAPAPSRRSE